MSTAQPQPQPQTPPKPMYSEEKAVHLVRVFSALLSSLLLIGWLHLIIVKSMAAEGAEMVSDELFRNRMTYFIGLTFKVLSPLANLEGPYGSKRNQSYSALASKFDRLCDVSSCHCHVVVANQSTSKDDVKFAILDEIGHGRLCPICPMRR